MQALELPPNLSDLLLDASEFLFLLALLLRFAVCGEEVGGVFSPARVVFSFLDDAAQLGRAQACYYGLIHHYTPQMQNNIRVVDHLALPTAAFYPAVTSRFYFKRCYSPKRLGNSTLGYFSFSPFFGKAKWLAVRVRIAGLLGTKRAVSSFLL